MLSYILPLLYAKVAKIAHKSPVREKIGIIYHFYVDFEMKSRFLCKIRHFLLIRCIYQPLPFLHKLFGVF